ncbi:MAG: glycosyltransferase family 4 protein [Ignavibacteria bacterium]|nr:glycosyltransferase family 4 protein [Ignavibacteria bacterium]
MKNRRKILFTSFDGIPNENQGGPNNIILKLLSNLNTNKFMPSFLSYKNYIEAINKNADKPIKINLKKSVTDFLYYNSNLYKKITTNRLYLERHFKLRDTFFEKRANEINSDIIHSHDTLSHYYFRNKTDAFKILTIHGNGSIENDWTDAVHNNTFVKNYLPELKRREIEAFNNADVITFPGCFAKDLFLNDYRGMIKTDKDIRIINNGINKEEVDGIKPDTDILKQYGYLNEHDAVFLNIAAHVRQKNIDKIIAVIYELVQTGKNPLLINAGCGPLTENIKSAIETSGLIRNIKLAGKIGHTDIIKLMKSSDALIMLSDRVIFDLVMLEAVSAGIPIISDTKGGNEEILSGYGNILNTENMSVVEIAELIRRKFYIEKSTSVINNDAFKFTLSRMSENYEKLYETKSG